MSTRVHPVFFLSLAMAVLVAGCMPEVPATNPYDPEAPAEQQKKARLVLNIFGAPSTPDAEPIPLADVAVSIADGPSQSGSDHTSNADGVVTIEDLVPGAYQFNVWHPQYGPPRPGQAHWVTLGPGDDKASNVYLAAVVVPEIPDGLPTNYTLVGVAQKAGEFAIEDPALQDHSGISVRLRTADEEPTSIETTTDAAGRFGLAVNPGDYVLYFNASDHTETGPVAITVSAGEQASLPEPVVLNINPGRIEGLVELEGVDQDGHGDVIVSISNTSLTAATNAQGAFQITDAPAGTYTLRVAKAGYDSVDAAGVVVRGGRSTVVDPIRLRRSRGAIEGIFTLADAQSSDGIAVQLTRADGAQTYTALTSSTGRYRFDAIPVGSYAIEACKTGYLPPSETRNIEVSADSTLALPETVVNRPNISLAAAGGNAITNTPLYRLRFQVPTERVKAIKVTGDAQVLGPDGRPVQPQNAFVPFGTEGADSFIDLQFDERDGPKLVQVQFRGDDCYLSEVESFAITLDQEGPGLIVAEFEEGANTNSRDVNLRLGLFDADFVRITSNDIVTVGGEAFDPNTWIAASQSLAVRLTEGDGDKSLNVQARDAAGNLSPILNAQIELDTVAPQDVGLEINDGAAYVDTPSVTLTLRATGADYVLLSNSDGFAGAVWEPYSPIKLWTLGEPDQDGNKTVYARFRDEAGNMTSAQDTVSDVIELDQVGEIRLNIDLTGPENASVTDVTVLLDGEPLGSPSEDGSFVRDNIAVGQRVISAVLQNYHVVQPITASVAPRETRYSPDPEPVLRLRYNTGTLAGQIDLADTDACSGIRVLVDGVVTNAGLNPETCRFSTEVNIGRRLVRIERDGFETVHLEPAINSAETTDVGLQVLPRARGTAVGVVELQGQVRHQGIVISFQNTSAALGSEQPASYTAISLADGSFTREAMWVGSYDVFAEKEGFNRKSLGSINILPNGITDVTGDNPVILAQQVGDFLINNGAAFTNDPNVVITTTFSEIQSYRFRIDGGPWSEPVLWSDPDNDGAMLYGQEGQITLPAVAAEDDSGDRTIEIRTLNLEGDESAEPYFQATIRLDTQAPTNGRLVMTGSTITVDGETVYSNASQGEVTLDLGASDANGIARVRLSPADDCQAPQGPCEDGQPLSECESELYRPLMNYILPNSQEDGTKRVWACFIDPAGNVSESVEAVVELDTSIPVVQSVSVIDVSTRRACTSNCVVNDRTLNVQLQEAFNPNEVSSDTRAIWISRDDETFSTGGWESYAPNTGENVGFVEHFLPPADGPYTLYFRARDVAQNTVDPTENANLTLSVILDATPPPLPAITHDEYVNEAAVELSFTNLAGVDRIEWSWDPSFEVFVFAGPNADVTVNFPNEDEGPRTLYVRYRDAAQNLSPVRSLNVNFDATAPTVLSHRINYGNPFLATADAIPMEVVCDDGPDGAPPNRLALQIQQQNVGPIAPTYSGNYVPLVIANLVNEDGAGELVFTCSDPAGNVSAPVDGSFVLDTQDPVTEGLAASRVTINQLENGQGGAAYTNQNQVSLTLLGVDNPGGSGIVSMAIGNGNIDCDTASYGPYRELLPWQLPAGDIEHTVSACFKDRAGRTAQVSDSIILDTVAPTGGLTPVDGAIVSDPDVRVRPSIDGDGAGHQMKVGAGFVDCGNPAGYLPFSTDIQTIRGLPEGRNEVSICLRDRAGNATRYVESIDVDLTDPSGFMVINQGATYTTTRDVVVNITPSDQVSEMKVRNGAINCSNQAGYQAIDLAYVHQLGNVDGQATVSACLRKSSGRFIELESVSIILDQAPPTTNAMAGGRRGIRLIATNRLTNNETITARLAAQDATSGVSEFKLSRGDACIGGAWQPWIPEAGTQDVEIQLEAGDRVERDVSVLFRDAAGNESSPCASDFVTIDTVPLSLTGFTVVGGAGDAAGYTSQVNIEIDTIGHAGTGTCYQYEVSEQNNFPAGQATTRYPSDADAAQGNPCPAGPLPYTIQNSGRDGLKTLYARVLDQAGNYSAALSSQIELDRANPELTSITLDRGSNANPAGGKFTDRQDVMVQINGAAGGNQLRYELFDGRPGCPAGDALSEVSNLAPSLSVRFATEGEKTVCVAVQDEVGNVSPVRSGRITIDTTPPAAPNLTPNDLGTVNSACAEITPSGAVDPNFWKWEARRLGEDWTNAGRALNSPVQFDLAQDAENILEIRAVDQAGNRGEASQVSVEEASSFFIPTGLQIKQICNGGQYAIMKDMETTQTVYTDIRNGGTLARYVRTPTIGLLDLTSFEYRQLSAPVNIQEVIDPCNNFAAMRNTIIDAACSPEPGESALLVVSPAPTSCVFCSGNLNGPAEPCSEGDSFYAGQVEMVVWPDPLERPNLQGQRLGPAPEAFGYKPIKNPQDNNSALSIVSIDVLDWTGDTDNGNYAFRALATDVQRLATPFCLMGSGCDGEVCASNDDCHGLCVAGTCNWDRRRNWRFNVRRLTGNANGSITVGNRITSMSQTSINQSTLPNHHRAKGVGLWGGQQSIILRWQGNQWRVYHHDTNLAQTTHLTDFWYLAESDPDNSPFRSRLSPAHWLHTTGLPAEGRLNFLLGTSEGTSLARRSDNGNTQALGSGAPTRADSRASFFEVGVDNTHWVDSTDTRRIYQSNVYGQNGQTFRYAVDTTKGLFPFMEGGGPDEPFVLYHTTDLAQGVVIVTKDQAGCAD